MSIRLTTVSLAVLFSFASTAQADCKSDIQDILQAMETNGPYRMEMTSSSNGTDMVMQADIILPHSMKMKTEGMEVVMTPNGVWMAQDGKLKKMPDGMKDQMQAMIRQGINLGLNAVEDAQCPGSTAFEGGTFEFYKYSTNVEFMGIKTSSKIDMYVNDDNKAEWLVVDGEAMGIKSHTKQHIIYDDSITIPDPQ